MKNILVVCAHSDDQIFGPGGTLIKQAKQGASIHTVIFSYGIGSHPHYKPDIIAKTRAQEAERADKKLGGNGVVFLAIKEQQFIKNKEYILKELSKAINKHHPDTIFTHSPDDPHKDHRNVHQLLLEAYDKNASKADIYVFDVWTFWNLKKRNRAKLVVDISNEFEEKLKILDTFKSQKLTMITLLWTVYLKAFLNGLKYRCKQAEVFYKVR